MTKELPVTPEGVRAIADLQTLSSNALTLYELADWLEQHMPLYREAVELLEEMPRDLLDFAPTELEKRKRALLAKVKGE